jgi:hypothetical protein
MRAAAAVALLLVAAGTASADLLVSRGPAGVDRYSNTGTFLGT